MPRFTHDQMRAARKADLYKFLISRHGDLFVPISGSLRMLLNRSISIKDGYTGYYDFASGDKGNSVDFLTKYLGYDIDEAVFALLNIQPAADESPTEPTETQIPVFPPMAPVNDQVRSYLHGRRGISLETVDLLISRNLLYEDTNHNCVFINAVADWGEVRGTSGKPFHGIIKNARPDGFWWLEHLIDGDERKKTVFICEAAIDAISLYEIYKITNRLTFPAVFVSIGGVAKQQTIERLKKRKCIIAVDNDIAGEQCRNRNGSLRAFTPKGKDWNDDLIAILKKKGG